VRRVVHAGGNVKLEGHYALPISLALRKSHSLLNLSSNLIRRGVRPVRTLSALLLERYSPTPEYNLVSGP
jgi:hypothetical protein